MTRINTARVVLGGLIAGLVINVSETVLNTVVIAAPMEEVLKRLNLPPVGGRAIAAFVVLCFALGIALIWLYAAIRPRYGAGPKTAACAAAAVWFFAFVFPGVGMFVMGFYPTGVMITSLLWGLGELLLGGIAGAWLYKESAG